MYSDSGLHKYDIEPDIEWSIVYLDFFDSYGNLIFEASNLENDFDFSRINELLKINNVTKDSIFIISKSINNSIVSLKSNKEIYLDGLELSNSIVFEIKELFDVFNIVSDIQKLGCKIELNLTQDFDLRGFVKRTLIGFQEGFEQIY